MLSGDTKMRMSEGKDWDERWDGDWLEWFFQVIEGNDRFYR